MPAAAHPRSRRLRWVVGLAVGAALGLTLLAVAVVTVVGLGETPEAIERRWQAQAGFDPLTAYPPRDDDATARRLDALAAPLGLGICRSGEPPAAPSPGDVRARIEALREPLRDHLRALRRPEPALVATPPELASLLEDVEPALSGVADLLAREERPRWARDLEAGAEMEFPRFTAHLRLHQLLAAAAADAAQRGERDRALRWLEASWRLHESLLEEPHLLHQLVAIAELGDDLALLRAIPGPLPGWEPRLAAPASRQRMARALRLESWMLVRSLRAGRLDVPQREHSWWLALAFRILARRGVSQLVDAMDRSVSRLERGEARAASAVFAQEYGRLPRWNVVARMLYPNFGDAWDRAVRADLAVELTRRALAVRGLLRAGDAAAVEALSGEHPAEVKGLSWVYRVDPDGVVIRAGEEVGTPGAHPLPLEIRLRRP